ncbi:hypothetical protein SAY87_000767 [Trapa incisa]|uniref:30-kDa cleavage and polyadenylation specificity factor 30 n=1 Tax=Trapa incisa TaxID=236973 RepID=A0AAN7GCK0_9MYRT|nr:hypothetical protein SAY87_000767 [Trapa incisa]
MDEDGGLSFDFEGGLDTGPPNPAAASAPASNNPNPFAVPSAIGGGAGGSTASAPGADHGANPMGRRSFRQTVCRHWLRSLCMKGDNCGFLHQYDKARMPICRFFRMYGECREQDCVYKHTTEDMKECNMYKLGFCPNGPDCRYRHVKMAGPPPSVEEVLQKMLNSHHGNSNRFFQQRKNGALEQTEKSQLLQGPNPVNQGGIKPSPAESANVQQQQQIQQAQQPQQPQQPINLTQSQNQPTGLPSQAGKGPFPLPQGVSRYFIVKSCNRENLEVSVQQGVWATQRSNEAKLNEAFDSTENVILIFSVNRTRHFQGCAKMMSRIGGTVSGGNWKYAHGTAHYGRNFSVKWLKLCELSFQKTRHLRNPYNENLPVKISRDCQELEPSIGEQLASLLYLEPDSELMAVSLAAESKREEEKAKGFNTDNGAENPDIVPFEDNEEEDEEEEEESEEEEEGYGSGFGAAQGRGMGRGMMWPPMPLPRGARPMPGMRGFSPMMMGSDGFSYGPDGFGMPDLYGIGPARPPFPPYGPRFSGDFSGPGAGMMFPGRPGQPGSVFPPGPSGFGMMMGRGPPFMGGGPRAGGRPAILPQPPLPPQSSGGRMIKKPNAANERYGGGSEQGKAANDHEDQLGGNSSYRDEYESDSEDEAPRRSRHGEARKKRRESEPDGVNMSSDH